VKPISGAVAQILVGFVAVNISCVGGSKAELSRQGDGQKAVPVESDLRLSEVLSADWPAKRRCQGYTQFRGIRSVTPVAQCRS
jgi:hypothetical protein